MTQSILTDIKKAAKKSLKAQEDELANTQKQLEILSGDLFSGGELPFFKDKIAVWGNIQKQYLVNVLKTPEKKNISSWQS